MAQHRSSIGEGFADQNNVEATIFGFTACPAIRASSSESLRLRCLHSGCKLWPISECDEMKKQLLKAGPDCDALEVTSGIFPDDQHETDENVFVQVDDEDVPQLVQDLMCSRRPKCMMKYDGKALSNIEARKGTLIRHEEASSGRG